MVDVRDLITCFKFVDDRLRGLGYEGHILPFPIDFDGRPYNTITLPCERAIMVLDARTVPFSTSKTLENFTSLLSLEMRDCSVCGGRRLMHA